MCSICTHVCVYEESGKKLNILYSYIYESGQKLRTVTILPLEELGDISLTFQCALLEIPTIPHLKFSSLLQFFFSK